MNDLWLIARLYLVMRMQHRSRWGLLYEEVEGALDAPGVLPRPAWNTTDDEIREAFRPVEAPVEPVKLDKAKRGR